MISLNLETFYNMPLSGTQVAEFNIVAKDVYILLRVGYNSRLYIDKLCNMI